MPSSGWPMRRSFVLTIMLCRVILLALLTAGPALAQHSVPLHQDRAHAGGHHGDVQASAEAWEGSAKGIAYSERNHHIAGLMVTLMGLAELTFAMRLSSLTWARILLPSALLLAGFFLMIWSDHEAWPIGSLSFSETFMGA